MVTVTALRGYIGAAATAEDEPFLSSCLAEAEALVAAAVLGHEDDVPDPIKDRATLECASELVQRRNAPNGVLGGLTLDGAPVRLARDPMVRAWPLLRPFTGAGLA